MTHVMVANMPCARLRLLQTTDLHMHLLPYDYASNASGGAFGLSQVAGQIAAARADGHLTLLFDTGDFLQGTPLADTMAAAPEAGQTHPMIAAMNRLGYDAIVLGNHDFDYGIPALRAALGGLACPVLTANVAVTDNCGLALPSTLIARDVTCADGSVHPIRIGVVGLTMPRIILATEPDGGPGVRTTDVVAAARPQIAALKAAGADLIVALCHSGIGADVHVPGMENAAVPLAALPGVDALLTGHVHGLFPGPDFAPTPAVDPVRGTLHGKPATMPGAFGSHLGQIDIDLEWRDEGWVVTGHDSRLRVSSSDPASAGPDGEAIQAVVAARHAAVLERMDEPIARTDRHLHSYFAQIGQDTSLSLIAEAQMSAVRAGLADTAHGALPLVAAVASFRAGGRSGPSHFVDIPPGPLTLRDVSALCPFSNRTQAVLRRGRDLLAWLEHAAQMFLSQPSGDPTGRLTDSRFATYHFDTMYGLTYEIDLTRPANRIRNLRHSGQPVDPDQTFVMATNTYRTGGGGGYPAVAPQDRVFNGRRTTREELADFLGRSGDAAAPAPAPVWRFAPQPGVSARFATGPRARTHVADLTGVRVDPVDGGNAGFADFLLHL